MGLPLARRPCTIWRSRCWFASRRHCVEPITAGYDIALIGAGRVGQTLGRRLVTLGHRLTIVACRTRAAAERAVAFIGTGQPTTYDEAPLDVVQTGRGSCASRPRMMPLPPPLSTWRIANPLARGGSLPLQRSLEFDGVTRLETVRCPGRFHASLTRLWNGHC